MKKTFVALVLILALLFTLLCGCGTEAASSAVDAEPAESQAAVPEDVAEPSAQEPESAEAPESIPEEEALPAESLITFPLDETETLSYWHDLSSSLLSYIETGLVEDMPSYAASEVATNVKLEHVTAPSGSETDQFNLMVAANDYTDMIKNAATLYSKGVVSALDDDVIIDLTPYLEDYAPNYLAAMDMVDGYIKDATTDDGRIPTFVTVYVNGLDANQGLWIRKDIFDKAGIDIPVTYDDFEEALRALKDYGIVEPIYMNPNGVFPGNLLAGGHNVAVEMTFGMGAAASEPFYIKDGAVTFGAYEPEWLDYVKMLNGWYEEGLISKDFATNAGGAVDAAFLSAVTTGETAVFVAPTMLMQYICTSGVDYDPDFEVLAIREPVKQEGDIPHFGKANASAMTDGTAISGTCKNVELAVAWCNYWYTDEGQEMANWGQKDVTYTLDENGDPQWTDFVLNNPDGIPKTTVTNLHCLTIGTVNYVPTDTTGYEQYVIDALETWKYGDDANDIPSTATFTSEESEEYNSIIADVSTYYLETLLKLINGTMDFSEYDAFVENLKAMGVDDCVEIKQTVYDRYMAR